METLPANETDPALVGQLALRLTLETVPISHWHVTPEQAASVGFRMMRFGEEALGPEF